MSSARLILKKSASCVAASAFPKTWISIGAEWTGRKEEYEATTQSHPQVYFIDYHNRSFTYPGIKCAGKRQRLQRCRQTFRDKLSGKKDTHSTARFGELCRQTCPTGRSKRIQAGCL